MNENYDENYVQELKDKIDELELELQKDRVVVNKDLRWGLVGCKINYSWIFK